MMQKRQIPTENGSILDGVLFSQMPPETVVIAITNLRHKTLLPRLAEIFTMPASESKNSV